MCACVVGLKARSQRGALNIGVEIIQLSALLRAFVLMLGVSFFRVTQSSFVFSMRHGKRRNF